MQPYIILKQRSLIELLNNIQCCKSDILELTDSTFDEDSFTMDALCCGRKLIVDKFYKVSTICDFHSASENIFGNGEYENVLCVDENDMSHKTTDIESILVKMEGAVIEVNAELTEDPLSVSSSDNNVSETVRKIIPNSLKTYDDNEQQGRPKYPDELFCEYCGKLFKGKNRAYKFAYHRNRIHTKNVKFKCPQCDKIFFGERELKCHSICHETPNNTCHICGKTWNNRYDLNRHILVHDSDKLFTCSFCKKEFKRKDHLRVHERTHRGNMPFLCTSCGSGFAQKTQLRLHYKRCPLRDSMES